MVHKEQYQLLADEAARQLGAYALHIGKIGEDEFVYSLRGDSSADFNPDDPTVIVVKGDEARVVTGADAQKALADTNLREFSTGRAIYKKYQVLVKNKSSIIGEGLPYAQAIVDAVASKAVKPSILYQYLELAEHNRKKIAIQGGEIMLV